MPQSLTVGSAAGLLRSWDLARLRGCRQGQRAALASTQESGACMEPPGMGLGLR